MPVLVKCTLKLAERRGSFYVLAASSVWKDGVKTELFFNEGRIREVITC